MNKRFGRIDAGDQAPRKIAGDHLRLFEGTSYLRATDRSRSSTPLGIQLTVEILRTGLGVVLCAVALSQQGMFVREIEHHPGSTRSAAGSLPNSTTFEDCWRASAFAGRTEKAWGPPVDRETTIHLELCRLIIAAGERSCSNGGEVRFSHGGC